MRRLILCLLLIIPVSLFGQQTVVQGFVLDLQNDSPIPGATIAVSGTGTQSDADGRFTLSLDTPARDLKVSAIGYKTQQVNIPAAGTSLVIRLRSDARTLQEVVVSGTLREVRKSESPIAIETYSNKFFQKNITPNIFEGLSILNGVQPQLNCNVCNTGDIHINGMEGPYTMVLVDGMPIVSSLSTVYGLSGIPTSLIKRIEIVKGPASTLYGSEAVAGLINIITKDPASTDQWNIDINATSRKELNADLGTKWRIGKTQGILGVNAYNYQERYDVNNDHFTDVTLQRRVSVFNKWNFHRRGNLPASLAVRYYKESRWGGELNWGKSMRGSDQVYAESIYTDRVELIGNYGLSLGREKLLLEYSYNYHLQDAAYGTKFYKATQHTGFAQLRWEKRLGQHYLLAGLPFRYIHFDDNTPATSEHGRTRPNITRMPGVFLQDEWHIDDAWTLLGGLRYEQHNTQGSITSPRLALKWEPNKGHIFRLSGGNGFRVVNLFTEDHLALSGARELVIIGDLKPERSWNGSLNYNGTWYPSFGFANIDLSAFYTYFMNKILPDYDSDPQKIIYRNLPGHAVSQGLSANIDLAFRNGFKALIGATAMDVFTKAEDASGRIEKQDQLFAPKFSATWALSYDWRKAGLTFDFTGKLYGPQRLPVVPDDYRPEYSPWFALANVQATKKIGERIEVYAAAKNLFNFIPTGAILHPDDPFDRPGGKYFNTDGTPRADTNPYGYTFDPSYNYAPVQGIKGMVGIRYRVK